MQQLVKDLKDNYLKKTGDQLPENIFCEVVITNPALKLQEGLFIFTVQQLEFCLDFLEKNAAENTEVEFSVMLTDYTKLSNSELENQIKQVLFDVDVERTIKKSKYLN